MKRSRRKSNLPRSEAALRFVCGCFDIGDKELRITLERMRQNTPNPDNHFPDPAKLSRTLIARAEPPDGPWHDALQMLRRETLYDRIRRQDGKPLFSFTGAMTENLTFLLLRLYEDILPLLKATNVRTAEAVWALVGNVFAPTAFVLILAEWRYGLGTEFQGETCWFLPVRSRSKTLKPVQRVLDAWLRVAGFRTAYGVSQTLSRRKADKAQSEQTSHLWDSWKKRVARWLNGQGVPSAGTLHKLVADFSEQVKWLDEPDHWKARFTLACAMQKLCDEMDDYFKRVCSAASMQIAQSFCSIRLEGIVCDDSKVLASERTFFAARLLQLRLQRDGKWETEVIRSMPKQESRTFPPDASNEEIAEARADIEWRMNAGNWFLEHLKKGTRFKSKTSLEDHIFYLGVTEVNQILTSKMAGEHTARRP